MSPFEHSNPRYKGKAFLRLLEFYVLWVIGELSQKQAAWMLETTPLLQSIDRRNGSWQSIIAAEMDLPTDFQEKIRDMWKRNLEIARNHKASLPPEEFARAFVDANLT